MEVSDVIRAVCAVHDISTSNQDRIKFTQIIEEFKEGSPQAVAEVAFQLIPNSVNILRHTGWTLLEDLIRYKWNNIPSEYRVELRNGVFRALEASVVEALMRLRCLLEHKIGRSMEGRLIDVLLHLRQIVFDTVEPCARCVVAMMEHEWPQNWPELNGQLRELSRQGSLHCAIVFAILRRVVENVATLASVANARRRKDMHSAICDTASDFVTDALEVLSVCPVDSLGTLAAKNIFGWLTELCSCMTSVSLEQHLIQIVDTVIRYLSTAERNIYEQAAQCLAAIATRKKDKHDQSITISAFFRGEVFSAILTTIGLAADESQFSEQHYRYLKSLCEVLVTLGNFLSKTWSEKTAPPNFETFLLAIVAFFNHDSLMLRYEACDVLVGLSTHKVFQQDPSFTRAIQEVFSNILKVILKDGYPSQDPPNASVRYSQMDFDDDLEWHNMFIRFRSRIQLLISENLALHFNYLLTVYEQTVLQRIIIEPTSIRELEWEAMQRFAKNLVQVAYERNIVDAEKERLIRMRDTLVNKMLDITDCDILSEMLSIHSPFLPSYVDDYEKLNTYVSLLRRGLLMSSDSKTLSRHTVSLILRAVQTFPEYFKNHVASMVSLYSEVDEVISKMQMAQLLQVLAVLSNSIDDERMKLELLRMAAGPTIEYLHRISWSFEDVPSFIKFNAFDTARTGADDSLTMNRIELRRALTCIQGVVQQVDSSSQLGTMLIPIYPCFFKLTRCLMELHLEENKALLHESFRDSLTNMVASERQQIYCSVGENIEVISTRPAMVDNDLITVERQYVHDLNEQAVTIIAAAVGKFPEIIFNLPDMPELLSLLITNIDVVPVFRLRHWIKKGWKVILGCCPAVNYPMLKDFFVRIVSSMQGRLQTMWADISHIDYDSEPTEEELFNEHLTCVVSREYTNFLRFCYLPSDCEDRKDHSLSTLGEWLFVNKIGLSSVIMTAFSSLTLRDSLLALKSIALCKALSEKLVECYDDEVGVYMLVCAIRSLQLHGADEVAGTPLIALVFHVYCALRRFSNSLPQVLMQVPEVTQEVVEAFDNKVRAMVEGGEVLLEKQKKEMARKLLKGVITLTVGEQHKKPVYLRPLPPIEKRRRVDSEPEDFSDIALLFSGEHE